MKQFTTCMLSMSIFANLTAVWDLAIDIRPVCAAARNIKKGSEREKAKTDEGP